MLESLISLMYLCNDWSFNGTIKGPDYIPLGDLSHCHLCSIAKNIILLALRVGQIWERGLKKKCKSIKNDFSIYLWVGN